MKIRDAQEMYRAQIRDYNSEMSAVSKRRKEIQNALKNASGADKDTLDKEAATIELTYKALQDKQNEYYDYVNDLTEQWCMWANAESAKQQGEAMKDYYRDMAKVEKRKKHKSLWDDEEEKQYEDPDEVGANATAQGTAPQIKSAGEIMSSTGYNGAMDSEN